MRFMKLIW